MVDKYCMSRIVVLKLGIKLSEFSDTVVTEFGLSKDEHIVSLNYWPVKIGSLVTGLKTPPVLLTSDGALDFFVSQLSVNKSLTLCVKFNSSAKRSFDGFSQSSSGFTTPGTEIKRQRVFNTLCSSNKSNHKVPSNDFTHEHVGLGSVGSKTNSVLIDEDLIAKTELA